MGEKLLGAKGLAVLIRYIRTALAGKTDREEGKGLSANDFTDEYRQLLDEPYTQTQRGLVPAADTEGFLSSDGTWKQPETGQSDWDEENPQAPAYIHNRPFGMERVTVIPEQTVTPDAAGLSYLDGDAEGILAAEALRIILNGEIHDEPVETFVEGVCVYAGNRMYVTGDPADNTGQPYCVLCQETEITLQTDETVPVTIEASVEVIRQLDPRYVALDPEKVTEEDIAALFEGES